MNYVIGIKFESVPSVCKGQIEI